METTDNRSIITWTASALFVLMAFAGGCTLTGIDEDVNSSVSDEDLEAASQILGESLSADNSGVILSLNDALTTVSSDGFTGGNSGGGFNKSSADQLQDDSGRGSESNYHYSYDPETGTHTVSFMRSINRPLFTKEVIDTLKYIFTDNNGEFIERPRAEKERIESIDYTGRREGLIETLRKNSSFVRRDTFLIDGVSDASSILQIDGVHNGRGSLEVERPNGGFMERTYQLEINFLNIEIDKALSQGGLEQGVTGTLSWEMTIDKNNDGSESTKTLRGTIEMNGDGTALLRFQNYLKVFQVNLNDGDVKDRDREFEGRVISVDLDRQSFTLRGGAQIFITDETEFDDDLSSLRQVQQAIQNGHKVWAEGEGFRRSDRFIATEVEFEREEDGDDGDDDDENREFEARVSAVNVAQSTFTLGGEVIIKVDGQTAFDDDSDYQSLQEVSDAINQGIAVKAEGEAEQLSSGADADLLALEVSFESEDGTDDNDSEED